MIYGEHPSPGTPGTWNRDVFWALNGAAVGRAPRSRRYRHRTRPPFRTFDGVTVLAGQPGKSYGSCLRRGSKLTHLPEGLLFAWRGGVLLGRMVVWRCGARTAYFRLTDEPAGERPCRLCLAHEAMEREREARDVAR